MIPTDKTNSFRTVELDEHIKWMNDHLDSKATKSSREKIKQSFQCANDLLEELTFKEIINDNEYDFLKETIDSKAIPTPKLSMKDHKKPNEDRDFPTRIVIPATNFTSGFPKLGFSGIRNIFDENNINHMKKTMTQANNLKDELETLNVTKNNSTIIVSLDIVSFYPSMNSVW